MMNDRLRQTAQMEKRMIALKALYSPRQIQNLELIPSTKKGGGFAKYETVIRYILEKKLKVVQEQISEDERSFRLIKGSDIVSFLEKYRPGYEHQIKVKK